MILAVFKIKVMADVQHSQ